MYFRCGDCLATTWLDRIEPVGASESLSCVDCGRIYTANPVHELGKTLGDHYKRTLRLSNEEQVDMPSAYSVLLGLMTLDHVRCLQGLGRADLDQAVPAPKQPPEVDPVEDEDPVDPAPLLPDLDPGFQRAVRQGHLTIREALRRGDREAYAAGLASRHGLTTDVAFQVADNRLHLRDAIRAKPPPAERVATPYDTTHVSSKTQRVVIGLCAVGLTAISWNIWKLNFNPEHGQAIALQRKAPAEREQTQRPPAPTVTQQHDESRHDVKLAATRVQRDDSGRVVEVIGPDPATVLIAFCQSDAFVGGREPREITQTVPKSGSARLGIFRDIKSLSFERAIRIRRDRSTGRWVAGDGRQPIPVTPAPEFPPDAFRLSVARR